MKTIDEIKLVSMLAHNRVVANLVDNYPYYDTEEDLYEEAEDGTLVYTQEVQEEFDAFKNYYLQMIEKNLIS